jgi:hypothetical protein
VRAWRFSYNARGIVEVPNRLRSDRTAVIVVHPWGIDDGQGWKTPEPAGVAFQCTPVKNKIVLDHGAQVIDPFLKALRGKVSLVAYSLPGTEDPIRKKLYRSIRGHAAPLPARSRPGRAEGQTRRLRLSGRGPPRGHPRRCRDPDAGLFPRLPRPWIPAQKYDPKGFWELPIPVMRQIEVAPDDVVIYDAEGYAPLRDFLKAQGIRHVLLAGYNTDMCVCLTTAGYKNLEKDFDVFLVGDATIATFPGQPSPRFATTASVSFASLNLFITQASWVRPDRREGEARWGMMPGSRRAATSSRPPSPRDLRSPPGGHRLWPPLRTTAP